MTEFAVATKISNGAKILKTLQIFLLRWILGIERSLTEIKHVELAFERDIIWDETSFSTDCTIFLVKAHQKNHTVPFTINTCAAYISRESSFKELSHGI